MALHGPRRRRPRHAAVRGVKVLDADEYRALKKTAP